MKFSEKGALKIGKKLIISDLHLGILGFLDFSLFNRIIEVYEKSKAQTLILNGDVKHKIGRAEIHSVERFLDSLKDHVSELIVIKGNHDSGLTGLSDYIFENKTLILHGHKEVDEFFEAKRVIVGHAHPAIFIKDKVGGLKEKVWMIGHDQEKEVVVMPAFNELCSSTAVNLEKPLGFVFKYCKEFEIFTINGFYMGTVKLL
uniref:Calcineurin-like phosphoesterase domain-containing protein n=1 Tax=Geoglobus ahangari TaxID=113653 RepID=A0A7C4S4T3_9EURY